MNPCVAVHIQHRSQRRTGCWLLCCIALAFITGCKEFSSTVSEAQPISHELWDAQVAKYVSPEGRVRYAAWLADTTVLNAYLATLSAGFPTAAHWTEAERLAYWINAYNAFTVQLILRNYPVKSIEDIGPKLAVPFINSVWDIPFIGIEGHTLTLNNIEHDILRKEFDEPRIHFAINCASNSCPPLLHEAYTPEKLEAQLEAQAFRYLLDPRHNVLKETSVELSKIFFWFGGDFKKEGSLIDFLNRYAPTPIRADASVSYRTYDWNLNE